MVAVADVDKGLKRIQKELALIEKSYVLVGFQAGTTTKTQQKGTRTKKSGLSMPEIAYINEYGTKTIPARPFMSTSFDENREKINNFIQTNFDKILIGETTVSKSLGLLGIAMVGLIQKKIREIRSPPNSPRTIKIKGSSKPLIDFGQMIQSVREKVVIR